MKSTIKVNLKMSRKRVAQSIDRAYHAEKELKIHNVLNHTHAEEKGVAS